MTDVEAQPETSPATIPKKTTSSPKKVKDSKSKLSHPPTAEMVNAAIGSLKERGGSSLQAIKKFMTATYKVDADKMATYIKKYLKAAVASGALVQTKGTGAAGSFKLPGPGDNKAGKAVSKKATTSSPKRKKAAAATVASKKKTAATSPSKKAAVGSKSKDAKKVSADKKSSAAAARVAKTKSPSKAKKVTKGPTKKPKAPKPKTTKKAGRKAASPKKK